MLTQRWDKSLKLNAVNRYLLTQQLKEFFMNRPEMIQHNDPSLEK